jgi:hypothetical protein
MSDSAAQSENDRRNNRRIPATLPVTFRFLASDNLEFFGTCVDVSTSGIQMKTKVPLHEGDRFLFSVPLGGFERIHYRARVCWAEKGDNAVHVGCCFESAA